MYIHPTILHYSPVSFPFLTCFACGSERCNALILSTNSALAMATVFRRPPLPLKPKHGAGARKKRRERVGLWGSSWGKKEWELGEWTAWRFPESWGGIPKSSILDFPLYTTTPSVFGALNSWKPHLDFWRIRFLWDHWDVTYCMPQDMNSYERETANTWTGLLSARNQAGKYISAPD